MDSLKYVGKSLNPALHSLSGKPVDIEAFRNFEINTFKELFRNQVATVVRESGSMFHDSVYKHLSPQFDAFERLLMTLEQNKCKLIEVTGAVHNRDEFLARVRVRIPIDLPTDEKLFVKPIAPDSNSFVLVSFYTGVCKEFTLLTKANELLASALKECDSSGFLSAWGKKQTTGDQSSEPPIKENEFADKAFDPNLVIPGIIKHMRLEHRYDYAVDDKKFSPRRFYCAPEGFIFRIEIDGYAAVPVFDGE